MSLISTISNRGILFLSIALLSTACAGSSQRRLESSRGGEMRVTTSSDVQGAVSVPGGYAAQQEQLVFYVEISSADIRLLKSAGPLGLDELFCIAEQDVRGGTKGLRVIEIFPGSFLSRIGIVESDLITAVGTTLVSKKDDLLLLAELLEKTGSASLTLDRKAIPRRLILTVRK